MKKFGPIAPRHVSHKNPLPYRGVGVRPDGSVTLAVSDRPLGDLDLSRKLQPRDIIYKIRLGSVTLTRAEWSALAPPDVRTGSGWSISKAVGLQFYPILNQVFEQFRSTRDVTDVQLVGRVAAERDGIAYLVYGGSIAGLHQGFREEAKQGLECFCRMKMISGVGSYDIRAGQMLSLLWVWDARFADFHKPPFQGQPGRVGSVVEWRRADTKAGAQLKGRKPGPETKVELADSTPEDALKTFLLALAAQDEATLRAVTLPHDEFDWLLKGPRASPDRFALLEGSARGKADETVEGGRSGQDAEWRIPGHQTRRCPRGSRRALAGRCATSRPVSKTWTDTGRCLRLLSSRLESRPGKTASTLGQSRFVTRCRPGHFVLLCPMGQRVGCSHPLSRRAQVHRGRRRKLTPTTEATEVESAGSSAWLPLLLKSTVPISLVTELS